MLNLNSVTMQSRDYDDRMAQYSSLIQYAETAKQREYLEAIIETGNTQRAAESLGITRRTIEKSIQKLRDKVYQKPSLIYKPLKYTQPLPKPMLVPAAKPVIEYPDGRAETILIIPDLHQDPRYPHRIEVLKWIARFGNEHKPSRVIQMGDWATLDSCSFHAKNDTYEGQCKPSIKADLENLEQSLQMWRDNLDAKWQFEQHFLEGNHEYRSYRMENANPQLIGMIGSGIANLFIQYKWQVHKFAEPIYIQDIGFVHHLNNGIGKPFGGKTGAQRAGNESVNSFFVGHTHNLNSVNVAKLGSKSGIRIVETGCALPWGEVESYAMHSMNNWWYGVTLATIQDGIILDLNHVSMITLMNKYSD